MATGHPGSSRARDGRGRRWLTGLVGILAIAAAAWYGREMLARWARKRAEDYLGRWALTAARTWIARAAWLDPGDGELRLMEAVCDRRWGQTERWRKSLERARAAGVPPERIDREIQLGRIRSGQAPSLDVPMEVFLQAGVSPEDIGTTFLEWHLARRDAEGARRLLEAWDRRFGPRPHGAYLWGLYWLRIEAPERALPRLEQAVRGEPWHELARKLLAELLESQDRLAEAFDQQRELRRRFPESEVARLGLARVLRKMNRLGEARQLLEPLARNPEPLSAVLVEMGRIALEEGAYPEADRWFAAADLQREQDFKILSAAAIAFALSGNTARAEQLFARHDAAVHQSVRSEDLRVRLAMQPFDRRAAEELQRLLSQPPAGPAVAGPGPQDAGAALYREHCRCCHGDQGGGDGPAARHLYPPPRDFRTGKFRLVRTLNGTPTPEDIIAVTRRGMPGTSMQAFDTLTDQELRAVTGEVLRQYRQGVREQLARLLAAEGDPVDPEELDQMVAAITEPGEVVQVPAIGRPSGGAVDRGRRTYQQLGCPKCHGEDGSGAWDAREFDEKNRPARPRDLVHEPLKGGEDAASIYLRIAAGMPGSPHPATWNLPPDELTDLVHFCRRLRRPPWRELTNHQRATWCTVRDYRVAFGETPPRPAAEPPPAGTGDPGP